MHGKIPHIWWCMVPVESPNLYTLVYTLYLHKRPGPVQEHPRTCHAMSFARSNQPKGLLGHSQVLPHLNWWSGSCGGSSPHFNLPGQIPGSIKNTRAENVVKHWWPYWVEGPYQAHMTWGNTDPVPVLHQFPLPRIHLHSTQYQDQDWYERV
jgi:hypothetical protein